jgi:hypothetical protein
VHFTPTYGSWVNQVEHWFGLLEQRQIKRGSHRSVVTLVNFGAIEKLTGFARQK